MAVFSPIITTMVKAAEKAAKSLLRDFGEVEHLQVSRKGPADFVSAADIRAEEIIYNDLAKARPEYGFLMEEKGEVKGKNPEFRFIIDPLDGTNNFLHGIPHWCISIGLEKGDEIVAGIVYDPVKNELFHAEKGGGAFMRHRRLRVSSRNDLGISLIGGGEAASRPSEIQKITADVFRSVISQTSGFRRMGAAALDLSYVAAGRLDAFWEYNLKPWDCAAGMLIVKEAGGSVTSLIGNTNPVYGDCILASNGAIHSKIKDVITKHL